MAFNSRSFHLLAVIMLAAAAVFIYDAARHGLWANLAVGAIAAGVLFVLIAASYGLRPARAADPLPVVPDRAEDLRVLLDQVPVPVIRYTEGESPMAINRAARSLFQTDDIILNEGPDLIRAITQPAQAPRAVLAVFGRQYAVSVSEIVSADRVSRMATLTDVQMEMHRAEAAALRETLQVLSHEIMNSLTPVGSLAEIADSYLAEETPEVGPAREALETLTHRARSLTRFIEAYRSVARLPEPVPQLVDPGRLIAEIMELFMRSSAGESIEFQLDIGDGLPRLRLDEALISQAIINVVTNAVEATDTVTGIRRINVAARQSFQNVVIALSDNGPGVPENIRDNLFSAFATTKPKGTGTGLNLARQIALAHGGNLQLLDSPDGLTTFAFTFPAGDIA